MIPTVLVVEDNALNLELVRDVILLDIRLPGLDGYAVLKRLKADLSTSSTPVVALTAQAMAGGSRFWVELPRTAPGRA